MPSLEFTTAVIQTLHHERFHHPHPHVQRKMEAVYLKSQGLPQQEICRLTQVSRNTLSTYLRQYREGGVARLQELRFYQPQSAFAPQPESLAAYFAVTLNHARASRRSASGRQRRPPAPERLY